MVVTLGQFDCEKDQNMNKREVRRSKTGLLFVLMFFLLSTGCATKPQIEKYPDLHGVEELQSEGSYPHSMIYISEDAKLSTYSRFIVEPVEIYTGRQIFRSHAAQQRSAPVETKREIAKFVHDEFTRVLQLNYVITNEPGPGVLRLKFTVVGVELTHVSITPGGTTASLIKLGVKMGKMASGEQSGTMGSVTLLGEIYDAVSNKLLISFLSRRSPSMMDIKALAPPTKAAYFAVTEIAESFKRIIDNAHANPQERRPAP
jgi:hypothetical protein